LATIYRIDYTTIPSPVASDQSHTLVISYAMILKSKDNVAGDIYEAVYTIQV
jgi:hypothetical protein